MSKTKLKKEIKIEYPCTECGKDAFIGYSASKENGDWNGKIKIDERLCLLCGRKRLGNMSFY